mgnify:CR=1 FL=1
MKCYFSSPRVSLVVVNYNQGRFLRDSLRSILQQTYRNLEVLFWDDGSTDQSIAIARSFAEGDDRLRVIAAPHQGLGLARLHALAQATGEYVGYVDGDDLLAPTAISDTVQVLEERSEIGWVYTDYQEMTAAGEVLGLGHRCQIPYSPQGLLLDFMTFHFRLIRRSLYAQVQAQILAQQKSPEGWALDSVDDYDLCLRLSERSPVYHLAKPLYYYRLHAHSLSYAQRSIQIQESAQVVEWALVRRGLNDRYRLSVNLKTGRVALLPRLTALQQLMAQIGALAAAIPVTIALSLGGLFPSQPVEAQSITAAPDGTGTQVNEQSGQYDITGGTTAGQNLFHSFGDFGLNSGETANFISPTADISNILGRVTGGNPSLINGLIQVTGAGSPNLFLINPAGMVFGSNASLNLPGSFTATTATGIGFEGGMFNAFGANDFSTLHLAPTHFSFATATGMILNEGQLSVPYGHNLWLVGGSVLNLGTIAAPGGNITLAAIPEERAIRLHQEGMILDLVLDATSVTPGQLSGGLNLFQPTDIPAALTSGTITHADQLTVSADGRVFLGSNPNPFGVGDVGIAGRVQGGAVQLMAAGQITPTDPSLVQTPGTSPTVVHFAENLTDPLSYTFIDHRSDQSLDLLYGSQSGTIATIILEFQDGIGEVTQALQEFASLGHQLDGIQIVAEGNQGYLWFGNNIVDGEALAAAKDQLQQWGNALGDGADLLIYS